MDCSLPGFPVHHQLPEFAQTHVHWVNNAIQPSHPLLPPSLPAFNLSQHQGLGFLRVKPTKVTEEPGQMVKINSSNLVSGVSQVVQQ